MDDPGKAVVAVVAIVAMASTVRTVVMALLHRRRDVETVAGPALADERLSRLEQAVDAIAVEVERISEGQRFTTRLLSDQARRANVARELPSHTPT